MGFAPATLSLGRWCFTTELRRYLIAIVLNHQTYTSATLGLE
jgi:hypothetical protein